MSIQATSNKYVVATHLVRVNELYPTPKCKDSIQSNGYKISQNRK